MNDKTKCPHCKGKGEHFSPGYKCMMACPACNGTGEVESFWTREAPKGPGWYMVIDAGGGFQVWHVWKITGEKRLYLNNSRTQPKDAVLKYWSREPIQFPDPPKEQPNDPT